MSEIQVKECNNPNCHRIVSIRVEYCCAPCCWADEGSYLLHGGGPLGHTRECDARHHSKEVDTC